MVITVEDKTFIQLKSSYKSQSLNSLGIVFSVPIVSESNNNRPPDYRILGPRLEWMLSGNRTCYEN